MPDKFFPSISAFQCFTGRNTLICGIGVGSPNSDKGTNTVVLYIYIKAVQCQTNPWPAVSYWPWCWNADAGLTHFIAGIIADARQIFSHVFRHSSVYIYQPRSSDFLIACLLSRPRPALVLSFNVSFSATLLWATLHNPKLGCKLPSNGESNWALLHSYELRYTPLS